jgi:hypothetical protein
MHCGSESAFRTDCGSGSGDYPELERAIRTERFFDDATAATTLLAVDNPFMRGWLTTIYFAALTQHALARGVGLVRGGCRSGGRTGRDRLVRGPGVLFQSPPWVTAMTRTAGAGNDGGDRFSDGT